MRKCFSLLFFLTMLLSIVLAAPYPRYGDILRCAIYQKVHSLHPARLSNYAEFLIATNIYEGLVQLDQNEQIIPALAKSWVKSSWSQVWLFHLAQDAKFHNGKPVTTADVKRSWEYLAKVGKASPLSPLNLLKGYHEFRSGKTAEISGVQVINESTLRLVLTKPDRDFLKLLTLPQMWVFDDPSKVEFTIPPIGTGQFKFDSTFSSQYRFRKRANPVDENKRQEDTEIQLVANENYRWGRPYLDRLTFRYYEEQSRARFDLAADNLEVLFISPSNAKELPKKELIELPHKEQIYLWFNPQTFYKSEWKNAVMYAIDLDSILQFQYSIGNNYGSIYNPEKAFRRLSSTGWKTSQEITLAYLPFSDNSGRAVAERIQRNLDQAKIAAQCEAIEDFESFENSDSVPDLALLSSYTVDGKIWQNRGEFLFLYDLPVFALRRSRVFGLNSSFGGVIIFDQAWIQSIKGTK